MLGLQAGHREIAVDALGPEQGIDQGVAVFSLAGPRDIHIVVFDSDRLRSGKDVTDRA